MLLIDRKFDNNVKVVLAMSTFPTIFKSVWRRGPEDLVMLHEEDDNNDLSMELVKVKTLKSYGVISGSHFILERRLAEAEESQVQLLGGY